MALTLPRWTGPDPAPARIDAVGLVRSPTGFVVVHQTYFKAESSLDSYHGYRLEGLTSSGRRDPAFSVGRPIHRSFSTITVDPIRVYALVPRAGGFIVAGTVQIDCRGGLGTLPFADAYRWDGTPDPTYGDGGRADSTPIATGHPQPGAAVVLPDGRIRICSSVAPNDATDPGIVLIGYTASGDRDASVGPEGVAYLDLGVATVCNAMVADASSRLIIAGTGRVDGRRAAIVGRFSADGAPDDTFGDGGLRTLQWSSREFTANALVRLGSTGFVLGGQAIDAGVPPLAYTARLTSSGAVDTAYGFGSVYRYPGGSGGSFLRSLDVAGNGRLLVGVARAETGNPTIETLVRISAATGRLDPAFGRNGSVVVFHRAVDTVVDGSGRTITVGIRVGSTSSVLVQRRGG